jgi:hypothetical protein
MQDEDNKNLQTLFEEQAQSLPEEPFVGQTLKLIKRQKFLLFLKELLPWLLAVFCCALASPWLIRGSVLLSRGLDSLFEVSGHYLATPAGILVAALFALTFLIFNRRLVF